MIIQVKNIYKTFERNDNKKIKLFYIPGYNLKPHKSHKRPRCESFKCKSMSAY